MVPENSRRNRVCIDAPRYMLCRTNGILSGGRGAETTIVALVFRERVRPEGGQAPRHAAVDLRHRIFCASKCAAIPMVGQDRRHGDSAAEGAYMRHPQALVVSRWTCLSLGGTNGEWRTGVVHSTRLFFSLKVPKAREPLRTERARACQRPPGRRPRDARRICSPMQVTALGDVTWRVLPEARKAPSPSLLHYHMASAEASTRSQAGTEIYFIWGSARSWLYLRCAVG